jgi:hypothetical protein
MVRVPDTISLSHMLGEPVEADQTPPYAHLSPQEVDQLILRCRRAMHSHRHDSLSADPDKAADACAARNAAHAILMNLLRSAPESKRRKIEAILRR